MRWAAGFAWLVVALDLAQVVALSWRPKHWGALAGALLYAILAAAAARGSRPALVVLAAMPAVPIGALIASAAGLPLPMQPDAATVAVLVVQIAAAASAVATLRSNRVRTAR
jgi:hypothetical protein